MPAKLLLTTVGTLGDLHPFIGLAKALQASGHEILLAAPEDHVEKAEAAGIHAVAVSPGFDGICWRLNRAREDVAGRAIASQRRFFEELVLPDLPACARALDRLAGDADAVIASSFALAAPMIAEKHGLPLVSVVLQPMALLSALDPPCTGDFRMMSPPPVGVVGATWNRAMLGTPRWGVRRLYGQRVNAVRAEHGLPHGDAGRLFDPSRSAALTLCLYSSWFAPLPADAPANVEQAGFPQFDGRVDGDGGLDPELSAFLQGGPPPLVFTLGSFAVHAGHSFYLEAATVARRLGKRAVLLTGGDRLAFADRGVIARGYVPHSQVFPHAAAIVHHGGIGTTGQALRAGKPQLVVPHMGDQLDHARRVERLGVGRSLPPARFAADRVTPMIQVLLKDAAVQERAARLGRAIRREDAAGAAVLAIETMLAEKRAVAPVQSGLMSRSALA